MLEEKVVIPYNNKQEDQNKHSTLFVHTFLIKKEKKLFSKSVGYF